MPVPSGFNGGATFRNCYHESLHNSMPRVAVNYANCLFCGREMLRDSVSSVCSRTICRAVRIALQRH